VLQLFLHWVNPNNQSVDLQNKVRVVIA